MAQESTRHILQTFEGVEPEPNDGGFGGFTSDAACLAHAEELNSKAEAAWYMWKRAHRTKQCNGCEKHPLLTVSIVARGLDAYPNVKYFSPLADAAIRWQGLTDIQRKALGKVWRYDTAAGRMLRQKAEPMADRIARGDRFRDAKLRLDWQRDEREERELHTALESLSVRIDRSVPTHHDHAPGHCPHCPHPAEGQDQGPTGPGPGASSQVPGEGSNGQHQGPSSNGQHQAPSGQLTGPGGQLHRVHLWTPST